MAYRVRHCPLERLAVAELWGTVTRDQLVAAIESLYRPAHWDPAYDVLWDARGLGRLLLLPEDVAAVAEARNRTRGRRPHSRIALLVARDLDAEIGTLLLRFREPDRARGVVFRDEAAALAYLGRAEIPPAEACTVTALLEGEG